MKNITRATSLFSSFTKEQEKARMWLVTFLNLQVRKKKKKDRKKKRRKKKKKRRN